MPSTPLQSSFMDTNHHQKRGGDKSTRRVEFSPSLSSMGSPQQHSPITNPGITWDSETDHMLSYFLGGETLGGVSSVPDFPVACSTAASAGSTLRTLGEDETTDDANDTDTSAPPPTPAVQHFYRSSSSSSRQQNVHRNVSERGGQHRQSSSSSQQQQSDASSDPLIIGVNYSSNSNTTSAPADGTAAVGGLSSSLSNLAASLVSGGPMVQQRLQQSRASSSNSLRESFSPGDPSPISPAAMLLEKHGSYENLMLPPSRPGSAQDTPPGTGGSQKQHANRTSTAPGAASTHHHSASDPQAQHLAWLRELNAQAKLAVSGGGSSSGSTAGAAANAPGSSAPGGGNQQQQPRVMTTMPPPPHLPLHMHGGPGGMPPPHPGAPSYPHHHLMPSPHQAAAAAAAHPHHHPFVLAAHAQAQVMAAAAAAAQYQPQQPPVESEDKRRQRLERNRESARKSRRRKKERLTTLEKQVNQLHNTIEAERTLQIGKMVPALQAWRREQVRRYQPTASTSASSSALAGTSGSLGNPLLPIIQYSGPGHYISMAVMDFQYARLLYLTLPPYQKFLLWLAALDESFFTKAKDEYAQRRGGGGGGESTTTTTTTSTSASSTAGATSNSGGGGGGSSAVRASSSNKASSKQIGEELFAADPSPTAAAGDASRLWPLFCFELKFSVDQEERFVAAQKQIRQQRQQQNSNHLVGGDGGLVSSSSNSRQQQQQQQQQVAQVATAVRTVDRLASAVKWTSRAIADRETKTLTRILTPQQTANYHAWLQDEKNRQVCRNVVATASGGVVVPTTPPAATNAAEAFMTDAAAPAAANANTNRIGSPEAAVSLDDICQRLNEVLRITKAPPGSMTTTTTTM